MNDFHLPQKRRGTEASTHAFCLALAERGHKVAVACRLLPDGFVGLRHRVALRLCGRGWATDRAAGYPTHRAWYLPGALPEIVAAVRPDALVMQCGDYGVVRAAAALDVPVLYLFRFIPGWPEVPRPRRVGYAANSLFCRRRIAEAYGVEATAVVRPLVFGHHYRTQVRREEVTSFGLTEDKGADVVLGLAEALPGMRFQVYANEAARSPSDRALAARAARLPNLRVTRAKRTGGRLYARTRLVLAPSRWEETWGRMATEAHVNAIPVLASDRGGLPEAVGGGGICLPADSPVPVWRDALREMWEGAAYDRHVEAARRQAGAPHIEPDAICREFLRAVEGVAGAA
ncbi:glycosyltransferase [Roseomonas sp. CCTCC AB2023176]|uniref:glycosyltransferase n=1 Tax=Roseomonas sp. CCTCC AB2023176 TaxID=3342640 RepID=UPI0035DA2CD1